MGKGLIITEKPSVARSFADALVVKSSEKTDGYIEDSKWIITWCLGHLVTLSYPDKYDESLKSWRMESLPFLPKTYKYQVIDEGRTKKQFKIVAQLLNRLDVDVIYNAGDSGREGEYIQRLVYTQAKVEGKKNIRRIWIDSQTREEILRGIRDAAPESKYDNLYHAAIERAIEDYAVGINFSRMMTCKFGYEVNKKFRKDKYVTIAVGRVMTCVLGLVVNRENEIRSFKPTNFYRIAADHGGFISRWKAVDGSRYFEGPEPYNETGLKDEETANALVNEMQTFPYLEVITSEKKKEKKNAPLLFNLAELQAECTKRYKISPDETLAVAQSLYEKKLTTYPRTDARVLSTPVAKEIRNNITGIKTTLPDMAGAVDEVLRLGSCNNIANTRYTDDSKITDHYAIIPTGQGSIDGLTDRETAIYRLIVKRFLAIFYPAAVYDKYELSLKHKNGEMFFVAKKFLSDPGYLAIYEKNEEEKTDDDEKDGSSNMLQYVQAGNVIPADFSVDPSATAPPKRYTSGSMVLAMEHAGRMIEDEELRAQIKESGIGTSATRAEVIKKLTTIGYISLNKKTQILTPTQLGEDIVGYVNRSLKEMLSPSFTASWEKGLSQIEAGSIAPSTYREKMEEWVRKSVETIRQQDAEKAPERKPLEKCDAGICPACGSKLYYTKEYGYFCEKRKRNDKKSCQFGIGNTVAGRQMTREDLEPLLKGMPTKFYDDFVSSKGNPFTARLVMKDNGKIAFEPRTEQSSYTCPKCGKALNKSAYKYLCSCGFEFPMQMAKRPFSQEEMNLLAREGRLENIEGFTSKKGTTFSATITYKNGSCEFDFGENKKKSGSGKKGRKKGGRTIDACDVDVKALYEQIIKGDH